MSSPQQAVNIAFICDENYALCTGVAIYSLIKNKRPDSIYRIFILCIGVNAETAAQFHSLNSETVSISVINDSLPERYDAQVKSGWHVSPSALFKFNLPEIFPTLDKVLYLDGDILVQQDITQLYDQDISDYYAAVVKDKKALTFQGDFRKRLNIRHDAYFNSGVMLLNLSLMRRHDMTNQLIRYRETGINYFMDQDALNVIFRENVLYLSLLYNLIFSSVRDDSFSDTCAYYELADIKDKEDLFNRAYILHFSSPDKPWVYYDIPCADKWFSYYIASPFAAFQLERRSLAESIKQNPQSTNIQNRVVAPNSNHRFHMSTEPKLSVIIPVYNAGKYLEKCLNSIQKQTFLAFEVICIDDGSTDGSPAILKRFAKTDSRFQIISQRQQYAGVARNVGIQQARGEYIVFLDADDWFASTALEEFYARAVGTKADVIISTAYTVDARTGEKLLARWCLREQFLPKTKVFHAHDIPEYIYNISSGNPWAKCFRRQFILDHHIEFLPVMRSEDFYFVYQAYALAGRIATIRRPTVYYRINTGNSLEDTKDETPLIFWESVILLKQKLIELNCFEETRQSFINSNINRVINNLYMMKTDEGLHILYNKIKEEIGLELELAEHPPEYFYEKDSFQFLMEIMKSASCEAYLFQAWRSLRAQKVAKPAYNKVPPSVYPKGQQESWAMKEIAAIHSSWSYRIGRFITFFPRKIRGGIRCYREHGMKYTLNRVKEKIFAIFGR